MQDWQGVQEARPEVLVRPTRLVVWQMTGSEGQVERPVRLAMPVARELELAEGLVAALLLELAEG